LSGKSIQLWKKTPNFFRKYLNLASIKIQKLFFCVDLVQDLDQQQNSSLLMGIKSVIIVLRGLRVHTTSLGREESGMVGNFQIYPGTKDD